MGAERRNGVVVPCAGGNIGVLVGAREVLLAHVVGQQAEEDGRDLGAGDGILRADLTVAIADDISEVVGRVQAERIVIGNIDLGLLRLDGIAGRVVPGKGRVNLMGFGLRFQTCIPLLRRRSCRPPARH